MKKATNNRLIAVILTFNEEKILPQCLQAVNFVDQILIFDSFSTDRTTDIAKEYNAMVFQRDFDNYANQRNAALNAVSDKFDWILMIDADEMVSLELKDEILEVASKNEHTLYRVRRKDMFQNKWIKQSSGYPTWFPRLFQRGTVKVTRTINEDYGTSGTEGLLKEHLIHYPFNKGLDWWLEKHERYSEMEAQLMLNEVKEQVKLIDIFSKDPVCRRKVQKRISYHLPFRPQLIFFAFYILKGGFLNGKAGYDFCQLRMAYEKMIERKYKKLKQNFITII